MDQSLHFHGHGCGSVPFRMLRKLAQRSLWKSENGTPELKHPEADSSLEGASTAAAKCRSRLLRKAGRKTRGGVFLCFAGRARSSLSASDHRSQTGKH